MIPRRLTFLFHALTAFLFAVFIAFSSSCNSGTDQEKKSTAAADSANDVAVPAGKSKPVFTPGKKVNCILQDHDNNYWFGTDDGAFRYDGTTLTHFSKANGLAENQILNMQEDASGTLWFGIGGACVSRYDGKSFTTFVDQKKIMENVIPEGTWKISSGDIWFCAFAGVYRYDGNNFEYLRFPKASIPKNAAEGKITPGMMTSYCILKDRNGNIWIGTQAAGVCRFDGKSFTWFSEKGLAPPAVRGIFEDRNGTLWFGNNGYGLFRYDGKSLANLTEENNLGNPDFFNGGKNGPGTMARVWTINEDNYGNLWVGTTDAGAWRFDGTHFTNYTAASGLTNTAVNTIYKDKKGALWFGTDGSGIFQFNGTSFSPVEFN